MVKAKKGVRVIGSDVVYSGEISMRKDRFSLDGKVVEKEIVQHRDSIGLVPVIDGDVILVTQYRRASDKVLLEIPAGKMEAGETAGQAAKREMAEEIGYAGNLKPLLRWYLAPGYSTEFMRVYVATSLRKIERGALDDDENIVVKRMALKAAVKKCLNGEIRDCKTVAALLAYYYYHHHSQSD
jgi:ADP-ribose pyrophosphatase